MSYQCLLPRLYKLIGALSLSILIGPLGYAELSKYLATLAGTLILIKVIGLTRERYENLKIFERGNIPSVGGKKPLWGDFFTISDNNNLKIMQEYHRKVGKNYGMFYGPDPWVLTTDLDLLQRIFLTESDKHTDRPNSRLPCHRESLRSLFQLKGDEWKIYRRAFNPSLAHKQMKLDDATKEFEKSCNKLIKWIRGHEVDDELDDNNQGLGAKSFTIDLDDTFKRYSLEVALKFMYGDEKGANMEPYTREETVEALETAKFLVLDSPLVGLSVIFDGLDGLLNSLIKYTQIYHYVAKLHGMLDKCLRLRRSRSKEGNERGMALGGPKKVVDIIIERVDVTLMDDDTAKANLYLFLIASFETTANTLVCLFWLLARHPEVQEKLRQALLTEGESAVYLDWVMKETLRLYPAVPSGIGRVVGEDVETSQGQTIFKGTAVLPSIYSIHHSEEHWGPDVEDFRPERFGEQLAHPMQYFAFGFGPRNCIGMYLAKAEISAAVTRILLKYRVESCASTPSKINYTCPLLVAMCLEVPINVKFVESAACDCSC